jgi:hypothetical protein
MIRASTVAVVALVAFDGYLLDGKYIGTLEALARSLIHFMIG